MSDISPLDLGPIDQVAYVVADLSKSLPRYEALYGPFETMVARMEDCEMDGQPCHCVLELATNNSGPIEIELIQVLEGETPHSRHLREHGEGLHHVRFRVGDLESKLGDLEAAGYKTLFRKEFNPDVSFAYLEAPEALGGSVIELLKMP